MSEHAQAIAAGGLRSQRIQAQITKWSGRVIVGGLIALALGWVGYKASQDPALFIRVLLNSITLAGLYFIVASGFTLIFGLMRVVNMAHGSFFLLGGYIALRFVRDGGWVWGAAVLVAIVIVGAMGLVVQQAFLRWNQGQELRQAMITIAISIILADQMLREFGGIALDPGRPEPLDFRVDISVYGIQYAFPRFFILLCAVAIGVMLWLWLKKTRMGMIIRAGVDDRQMVSALGINIQVMFAIAFVVGSMLAAFAGIMYGFVASFLPGVDTLFLLNSLLVVIIGGMGSLGGAAVGALLIAFVDSYSDVYLIFGDANWTNYSILFTFLLMVFVLAVRPYGLFGRPA